MKIEYYSSLSAEVSHLTVSEAPSVNSLIKELKLEREPSIIFQRRDRSCKHSLSTIIAMHPRFVVRILDGNVQLTSPDGRQLRMERTDCPFLYLDRVLNECKSIAETGTFTGGLIGYLGYGLVSQIEDVSKQDKNPIDVPDAMLMSPDTIINIDHVNNVIMIVAHGNNGKSVLQAVRRASRTADEHRAQGSDNDSSIAIAPSDNQFEQAIASGRAQCALPKHLFLAKVKEAKRQIEDGQAFQIVLAQRFTLTASASAMSMFQALCNTVPSAYNYILNFQEFQYIGASPETMLSVHDGTARLCALAGTRPRGRNEQQDCFNEYELKSNEKEMAEHLMLVDLGRNDLGKICVPGSIRLGPIAQVLRYSNVMHLGTEISGSLETDRSSFSALQACFPRGTVSGAPKIRAMQILSELEPEQRGIYAGAVGFFDSNGNMDTAIAIRSALLKDGYIHINAGAGIVYDSEPEAEYMETINKARSIAGIALGATSATRLAEIS